MTIRNPYLRYGAIAVGLSVFVLPFGGVTYELLWRGLGSAMMLLSLIAGGVGLISIAIGVVQMALQRARSGS